MIALQTDKYEQFEDTNGAIRNRTSKKNRQHNDQMKKDKRTKGHSHQILENIPQEQLVRPTRRDHAIAIHTQLKIS